jgi:putative transposase
MRRLKSTMKKQTKPEDKAANRMMLIMPLLEEGLDPSKIVELKKEISEKHELSYRTIGRYLDAYKACGFEGLKPKVSYKREKSTLPENYQDIVDEAICLRRECPTRSVRDIIRIMELEGTVQEGVLNRSTLQRHMQAEGFGAKQVKLYSNKGAAARRFAKEHRCMLFQGDIKYGPYLPIGKDGAKKQVYLAAFIDDATRYIVSAKFYENQKVDIIEDCLRSAVMHCGKPDAIYVDNGKQYRSEWLKNACAKLEIRLLFAKPYHPEGKGKIESFNRRIDSFLSEVALSKARTLDELNHHLDIWISEHYHKSPHHSLGGISPEVAFKTDTRPLKFIDVDKIKEAFLHTELREVDKTGCINFNGKKYEVGLKLMGRKVDVYYDPSWTDEVEIHHKDFPPFKAKKLIIGSSCGSRSELPEEICTIDATSSRLLDGLNKANITNRTKKELATVFRKNREVLTDV